MSFFQQTYKGKADWWRWLIILIVLLPPFLKTFLWDNILQPLQEVLPNDKNLTMGLQLSVSIILLLLFYLLFKVLHDRSFKTLITSRKEIGWMRFWFGFSTWGLLSMLVFSFSVLSSPENYKWNFSLFPFLKLFVVSVFFMSIQAFYNTVFIRSYVLQAVAFFSKKPWVALLIVIILFSISTYHRQSDLVGSMGNHILVHFIATSFLLGLIIILDDGLEIIVGMTLANDLMSTLFITNKSFAVQLDTILIQESKPNILFMIYVTVFVMYPIYFYFLYKMYKWKDWKQKLFSKIEKPVL